MYIFTPREQSGSLKNKIIIKTHGSNSYTNSAIIKGYICMHVVYNLAFTIRMLAEVNLDVQLCLHAIISGNKYVTLQLQQIVQSLDSPAGLFLCHFKGRN